MSVFTAFAKSMLTKFLLFAVVSLVIFVGFQRVQLNHVSNRLAEANQELAVARQQAAVDSEVIKQLNGLLEAERSITHEVNEVITVVEAQPGADTPVVPDVADAWLNGLERLRAHAAPGPTSANPNDPKGAVPATRPAKPTSIAGGNGVVLPKPGSSAPSMQPKTRSAS